MTERSKNAKPSMDVGPWKNVRLYRPHVVWYKERGDTVSMVEIDKSADPDGGEYWAHAALMKRTPDGRLDLIPNSQKFITSDDSWNRVVDDAKKWMRRNRQWTGHPRNRRTGDELGLDLGLGRMF